MTYKNLNAIVIDKKKLALFLNSLSLMEYAGAMSIANIARKTSKSTFLLEHMNEEFRHSFYLRQLAEKTAKKPIVDFLEKNTLSFFLCKNFIKKLNIFILKAIKELQPKKNDHIFLSYLLTTWSIENRALEFYQALQKCLDDSHTDLRLQSILSEEENHLKNICLDLNKYENIEKLKLIATNKEKELFITLWESISNQ